ncbi:MAG: LysR family transcriptional regulator [Anaerolineales bacterium]|nr:LysR family transcriptional regulator [Anaerolineales bacterium]
MEIYQLQGFVEVAQTGSFTRAAKNLYLTQPALSLQIKALEKELQEALFERQGRSIHLTAAGQVLLQRAQQILELISQTKQEIQAVKGLRGGRLAIATNDSYALYLLPRLIELFRRQFPAVELRVSTQPSAAVVERMLAGTADFGLITLPLLDNRVSTETLFWREDVAICSVSHPLAQEQRISLKQLIEFPLLVLEAGSTSLRILEQNLAGLNMAPSTLIELGSLEVIKRLAEINLGVAVVPGFTVEEAVQNGRLHALRLEEIPPRSVGIVKRRNGYLSPAAQMFIKMLKERTPEILLWSL